MSLPPDQEQRQLAARVVDRNIVVVAGAGSGKTTLLVERLLNLLLGRGLPLSSIMALTFTEKAAAEMRARLAAQLSRVLQVLPTGERRKDPASFSIDFVLAPPEAGGLGVSPDEVRRRALVALHELDGAAIGTIHSACADLLRRHPAAARLDPAFVVDDGTLTERILEDEWIAFQASTLGGEPGSRETIAWTRVLGALDAGVVHEAAAALLDSPGAAGGEDAFRALGLVQAKAQDLLERCERIEALGASKNCIGWADILASRLRSVVAGGVERLKSQESESPPDWPTKSVPAPGKKCASPEFVTEALTEARRLTDDLLRSDDATCDAVLGLARDLAARTRARLDAEGIVGFGELLSRARDVLLHDLGARRQVQERLQALLLDEFQDTDPLQYEIAFLLAEDPASPVAAGGDPFSARLLPGRLFIVGDPKQSIYRFRGADMAAYAEAVSRLVAQGALQLSLVANFRSRDEVLAPVNDLCGALIREDQPYQPPYERLVAAREVKPDPAAVAGAVELWSVRGGSNADAWRLAEGRCLAQRFTEWRQQGVISDWGRVVILLRAMTAAEAYQRALAEAGIPFVTQGGKSFFRRQEIVQAITLLRCLVRPHDGASILGVLRSASCGASDDEIHRFATLSKRNWSLRAISRLSADERASIPLVARTLEGLASLASRVAELPADQAVRVALLEPPADASAWRPELLALHAASRNGAQRLANLRKLVERAEGLAREDGLSLPQVVQRLHDELERADPQGESPLADEAVDAVRIMTIHQAKGLEFDVVVLPDLAHQKAARQGGGVSISSRGGMTAIRLRGMTNLAAILVADDARKHEVAEDLRVLYVALTRAKDRLVLVNGNESPKSNSGMIRSVMDGWRHVPGTDDGGAELHPGVAHRAFDEPMPPADADSGDAPEIGELSSAVRAHEASMLVLAAARRPRPRSPSGIAEQRDQEVLAEPQVAAESGIEAQPDVRAGVSVLETSAAPEPRDRSLARAIGVAVHLALESGGLDDADALARLGDRAARIAAIEAGTDAAAVAAQASKLLRAFAGSPGARALKGARILARELPFLLAAHDGADWQGFIDLVIEKDGDTWVVDWKTDAQVEPERHRAQLAIYAEAVRRWRGLDRAPRLALAYVAQGRWVEIDAR